MKRKSLANTSILVLSALVLSQSAFATGNAKCRAAQQNGSTYAMKEGGVQFTLPKGWEVKTTSDGVMVSKKQATDFAIVSISLMPTDSSALSLEQLFKVAWQNAIEKQKDFKDIAKVGDGEKTPPDAALPSMYQVFTAVQGNIPVEAVVGVIKGQDKRPVFFFGYSSAISSFDQDVMDFLQRVEWIG